MRTVSLKLDGTMDQRLETLARKRLTTKSDLVRAALNSYLKNEDAANEGSCLELARDLIGSFDGPAGLSSEKRYMKGFGK